MDVAEKQESCDAKNFSMAIRVGCPIALAKRANRSSCSVYFFFILMKIQKINYKFTTNIYC